MARCLITLLLGLAWASPTLAQAPHGHRLGGLYNWRVCPPVGCCPDDYCKKVSPLIPCLPRCGSCDDYCRKSMPCLTDVGRCGTCDDYCRKGLPCLLCPPWSPYLQCGPPDCHYPCRCR